MSDADIRTMALWCCFAAPQKDKDVQLIYLDTLLSSGISDRIRPYVAHERERRRTHLTHRRWPSRSAASHTPPTA